MDELDMIKIFAEMKEKMTDAADDIASAGMLATKMIFLKTLINCAANDRKAKDFNDIMRDITGDVSRLTPKLVRSIKEEMLLLTERVVENNEALSEVIKDLPKEIRELAEDEYRGYIATMMVLSAFEAVLRDLVGAAKAIAIDPDREKKTSYFA